MAIFKGENAPMFMVVHDGVARFGFLKNLSVSCSVMQSSEIHMEGWEEPSCESEIIKHLTTQSDSKLVGVAMNDVVSGEPVEVNLSTKLKEKKPMATNNKLEAFEYLVIERVSEKGVKDGKKDTIIIGPKTIMARDTKEVERLAIREVPEKVDIAMVEVYVRPFDLR